MKKVDVPEPTGRVCLTCGRTDYQHRVDGWSMDQAHFFNLPYGVLPSEVR